MNFVFGISEASMKMIKNKLIRTLNHFGMLIFCVYLKIILIPLRAVNISLDMAHLKCHKFRISF